MHAFGEGGSQEEDGISPELESEYSECISAISSARREAGVLGQTSEWRGDWEPHDVHFKWLM